MLSGIGGGDELKAHGIAVAQDLPGVGANLMDHPLTAIQIACRQPVSLAGRLSLAAKARGALDWIVRRDGLLASNHFECGAFIRSEAGVEFPTSSFICSRLEWRRAAAISCASMGSRCRSARNAAAAVAG